MRFSKAKRVIAAAIFSALSSQTGFFTAKVFAAEAVPACVQLADIFYRSNYGQMIAERARQSGKNAGEERDVELELETAGRDVDQAAAVLMKRVTPDANADVEMRDFIATTEKWNCAACKRGLVAVLMEAEKIATDAQGGKTSKEAFLEALDRAGKKEKVKKNCRI